MSGTLPHPASNDAPKYWQDETGRLPGAMTRYLRHEPLLEGDVDLIRAYLRQWVESPVWEHNPWMNTEGAIALATLRATVLGASTKVHIDRCVLMTLEMGMDPL